MSRPVKRPDKSNAIEGLGVEGHFYKWVPLPGGMLDQITCSCGWESLTYFDGDVYAFMEWKKHVKDAENVSGDNQDRQQPA